MKMKMKMIMIFLIDYLCYIILYVESAEDYKGLQQKSEDIILHGLKIR